MWERIGESKVKTAVLQPSTAVTVAEMLCAEPCDGNAEIQFTEVVLIQLADAQEDDPNCMDGVSSTDPKLSPADVIIVP
jgi:hypothetical protein